jgi:hypothetical protein
VGISLVRFPAYEVDLFIFTGRLDYDEGLRLYSGLDPDDPANAPRWLTYIDDDADFSGVPVTAYPEAKHVLTPKLKRFSERPGHCTATVCSSRQCEYVTHFWRAYVEHDPAYISHPVFFTKLQDACDWLKLPASGCEAMAEAIRTQRALAY